MKPITAILSIIAEQNPWWKTGAVPDYLAPPTKRPLAKQLWKSLLKPSRFKRYFLILGPRRV